VRSSAFMLLYGTVCVSLVWMYFSFKPLRAAPTTQPAGVKA
jgi:NNP family nitrate/nitrite transporter-like MFS transporter